MQYQQLPGDPSYPQADTSTVQKALVVSSSTIKAVITLILLIVWVSIVLGQALGYIPAEYENTLLISFVSMAIGYVYGKEVESGKLKGP